MNPLLQDKADCESILIIIIIIASTKCKIKKTTDPIYQDLFFCLRYNISTDDYDGWGTNSSDNNK